MKTWKLKHIIFSSLQFSKFKCLQFLDCPSTFQLFNIEDTESSQRSPRGPWAHKRKNVTDRNKKKCKDLLTVSNFKAVSANVPK